MLTLKKCAELRDDQPSDSMPLSSFGPEFVESRNQAYNTRNRLRILRAKASNKDAVLMNGDHESRDLVMPSKSAAP
jgi:hypothetical protein